MKKNLSFLLAFVFALGFLVRLYRFDGPVADWHSWRQSDTSAVSRNFIKFGFDVLHPRYDDLSNIQSKLENPEGFRFVEFPIYNIAQAGLFKLFDILTLEEWGRIVSIFSTSVSGLFIFLLVRKYVNQAAAYFSVIFYLFIPYSIYYGRTILPDPSMVAAILGGTYFFDKWLESDSKLKTKNSKINLKSYKFYVLSILFTAGSFLLKPYALFFTLPMIYLAFQKFGLAIFKKWQLWVFAVACLIPLIWWRIWMLQYPAGIAQSDWLFNSNGIRFRPAFFRWILYERLTKLILGYFGIIFLGFGAYILKDVKNKGLFISFILSSIIYITVIATGNVQHDYYQILIMPSIAMVTGIGAGFMFDRYKNTVQRIFLCMIILLSFFIAWEGIGKSGLGGGVKDYFNINNPAIVIAGKKADSILPKDAKVVAAYGGDTTFLYQINRQGWPAFTAPIEELIRRGANYMVIANPTQNDLNGFGKTYEPVASSTTYLILKLK